MATVKDSSSGPLSRFSFPRTGKRGVPQQFPRRLYEMLDVETKSIETDPQHPKIIAWSDSGKAFRIFDVAEFSASVLPKYFRTKKFSSFQRNLNLYGFTKVRRGVDTDMYAHPSFMKNKPEALLELRKITSNSHRRLLSEPAPIARSVSPPCTQEHHKPQQSSPLVNMKAVEQKPPAKIIIHGFKSWAAQAKAYQISPGSQTKATEADASSTGSNDRGKLDLLALALEQEFAKRP